MAAAEKAISSPLLEASTDGARHSSLYIARFGFCHGQRRCPVVAVRYADGI
jgi:hypothetical protein